MSRVNPRSVILDALREGPLPAWRIWSALDDEMDRAEDRRSRAPLLQRHLCHLRRAGLVEHLPDGRYTETDKQWLRRPMTVAGQQDFQEAIEGPSVPWE